MIPDMIKSVVSSHRLLLALLVAVMVLAWATACSPVTPPDAKGFQQGPLSEVRSQVTDNASTTNSTAAQSQGRQETPEKVNSGSAADLQDLVRSDPSTVNDSGLPISSIDELHVTGRPQAVDIASYRFGVEGLVDNPLSLTYDDLLKAPAVTQTVLLICPDFFVDNARWSGVPMAQLLKMAGVKPGANKVTVVGLDGYRQTLSLDEAMSDGVFLAYRVNSVALPVEHGFPLRLVMKGKYGNLWVKWVQGIEVE
jgi:DMSO/TMAO reductase YedYZ molybdopterin-dependent catalytic subunit